MQSQSQGLVSSSQGYESFQTVSGGNTRGWAEEKKVEEGLDEEDRLLLGIVKIKGGSCSAGNSNKLGRVRSYLGPFLESP